MCVDGVQRLVVGSLVELGLNKYGGFFFGRLSFCGIFTQFRT